jgi:steroid delta-isomerase-like uncharacterized protein
MSIEENKALIRRAYDLMNCRELDAYFALLAPEYIEHVSVIGDQPRENVIKTVPGFFQAFPDIQANIEDMVAEGDKVAIRVTWRGTNGSEFLGRPPTVNKVEITNHAIIRISGGRWAETWAMVDNLGLLQQLGVIPKQ